MKINSETMSGSWRHHNKCLFLVLLLLASFVVSEGSRLPKAVHWDQMLPKKLPAPSSSPSKGTNAHTTSSHSHTSVKAEKNLPSSVDGKV